MDTRVLEQFVRLAENLHFGQASEACHISVSALSRNIKQLEADVGAELFNRDNRSVELTHEGQLFLDYARNAMSDWETVRSALLEQASELHGEISIWCSVTASYSFLFELLSEFRKNHPQIEIKLHTGDPEHAISRVQSGTEDIAIGARPDVLPAGLSFKPVAESPLVFIAAANRPELRELACGNDNDWSEIPMILSERGLGRRRVDAWFEARGIVPDIYGQVAGNEAIVSMVSLGFGVGVVPQIVLDNSPLADTVEVLNIEPALQSYEVGLFVQKKRLKNPIIGAFWSSTE